MKRQITISLLRENPKKEEKAQDPEDITLYGSGAGMYSYLNMLAQKLSQPRLDGQVPEIKQ